ncbi:stage II sporulation protein M [Vallicoccus soli]|uniref:Stage II sporulation protein M n=1 Tax=Vallicoccus soli TaxID=2339232 RepID=A0A3A3Z1P5_9ACTN|nr:stage II sporulation protein M [Vallicoccus soli]RJK95398.1 stage II sporulation protein M [Vallicoccus soli]
MDLDAYVAVHRREWDRLAELVSRRRRLAGEEVDELVELYQRTATHLSVVRSAAPDAALVARLSTLVARARSAVTGAHAPAWREVLRFVLVVFPAACYRSMRWWVPTALAFVLVSAAIAAWVASTPEVQAGIGSPAEVRQLVEEDFEDYYSTDPAGSFAFRVWTNNAWVAALSLALGAPTLGLAVLWLLLQNALNVAASAGLMAANDRLGLFFGLILPHGLLELTAVFVAAGAGLRLGWTVVSPGERTRSRALAEEGRAAAAIGLGLVGVLLVSGVVEAFVTPSPLPTWARVGIGVVVEVAFLAYVVVLGRRAVRRGETGDLERAEAGDVLPAAG